MRISEKKELSLKEHKGVNKKELPDVETPLRQTNLSLNIYYSETLEKDSSRSVGFFVCF